MKLSQWFTRSLAATLAFTMVATAVPADMLAVKAEETAASPILYWNMTQDEDGTIKDLSGNGHNGTINGSVAFSAIDEIPVLDMTGGYVNIPDGTISTDATEITINMLVKIARNIKSSWMFCIGTDNKKYMYITGSSNQDNNMRAGVGNAPASGAGYNFESVVTGTQPLAAGEWQNVTLTCKDGGSFTFYLNGEKQNSISISEGAANNDTECTLQGLMTAGDGTDGYMGWSFYEAADPKFEGAVADFRIYEKEFSQEEVATLADDMDSMLESLKTNDFGEADINLSEKDCLGENASANEVTKNLTLPTKTTIGAYSKEAEITSWVSSNPDVISNAGVVTPATKKQTVTLTASVTSGGRTVEKVLTFVVPGVATDKEIAQEDAKGIKIPNVEDIRGNITLPSKGELGSKITWTSSDESVISTTANGKVAAGKVNRQSMDTKVTLTATVTYEGETVTKTFDCVVRKAVGELEYTDYLFAYFPYADVKDERIYFGISEDGTNFKALNDSKFVVESKLGTHGLRDPFVIRSPEGDRFYMIATDLTVAGLDQDGVHYPGMSWGDNQRIGSKSIMVWESTDLVNWSNQRMCEVSLPEAGCTWAPEAYWDEETEQYVVFWASMVDGKHKLHMTTTRDFYTFGETKVWFEEEGSVIDTTVIKVGDYYYRYTKNEAGSANVYGTPSKRIYCERSKSLTSSDWELVCNNSLDVSGTKQIEGGCISKINKEDVETVKAYAKLKNIELKGDDIYCLSADMTGVTIFIGLSDNIEDGYFHLLGTTKNGEVDGVSLYSMPKPDASHGTIMPITSEEYNNLMRAYDATYAIDSEGFALLLEDAKKDVNISHVTDVTSDILLRTETVNGAKVTWESSNPSIISTTGKVTRPVGNDVIVQMTATITVKGEGVIRDQVAEKSFLVTVKGISNKTVTFDAGDAKITKQVAPGNKVDAPENPQKKGYAFDGWYLGSVKYDFNQAVTEDITITAKWTKLSVSKAKLLSAKNSKKKSLAVKVKKVKDAEGYEFIAATNKKFKKGVKTVAGKKVSNTIKGLKKGKIYYVKVRAYKIDSTGEKVYGKYSSVKKVKIKK